MINCKNKKVFRFYYCILILVFSSLSTIITSCTIKDSSKYKLEEIAKAPRQSNYENGNKQHYTLNVNPGDIRVFYTELGKIVDITLYKYEYSETEQDESLYYFSVKFEILEDKWNKCIDENQYLYNITSSKSEIKFDSCGWQTIGLGGSPKEVLQTDSGNVNKQDISYVNKLITYINQHTDMNLKAIPIDS